MCMVCVAAATTAAGMALGVVSPADVHSGPALGERIAAVEQVVAETGIRPQSPNDGEFKAWTRGMANGTQVKFYAKYPQPGQKIQFMAQTANGPWREIAWKRIGPADLDSHGNYRGLTNEIYFVRTFDLTPNSFNRLRVDVDGKTVWGSVRATWRPAALDEAIGAADLEVCRAPQPFEPHRFWGQVTGFPVPQDPVFTPTHGLARIAIVPLDFPNAPGLNKPHDFHHGVEEFLNAWSARHTYGKLRWEVEFPNRWLRAPLPYQQYNHVAEGEPGVQKFNRTRRELATDLYAVASQAIDLTNIDSIYVIYPEQLRYEQVGIVYNEPFALPSPQGDLMIPIFGTSSFGNPVPYDRGWFVANVLHEIQHFQGIQLHAPGNGTPFTSATADPRAHSVMAWEKFLHGWDDERHVHCFDGRKPLNSTFELAPVDLAPGSKTSALVRIGEHKVLAIESRSAAPFNLLPRGSSGLTVYVVDTTIDTNRRCDKCGDLETELNQWAYYLRAEGARRAPVFLEWVGTTDMNILIQPGERVRYGGVTVEHISTDGVTRVRVSR